MVLVDTSVWIDHFRKGSGKLATLLEEGKVYTHPDVIGELACGHLKNRTGILNLLQDLPRTPSIGFSELLFFLEENRIFGKGIGWTDAQLLASAKLAGVSLWTLDKRLMKLVKELELNFRQK